MVSERKRLGAWMTPPDLVEHVLDRVLDGRRGPIRVLDPACGDGRFLAAVARRLPDAVLIGVDVDPGAAAAARAAVPAATIDVGDALRRPWAAGSFDVVVGNPPFLSQLAAATTRRGRSPHGGGPYADAAAEFLALAVRLARPDGGRVGLVLPQSVLATRDTAPVRDQVAAQARCTSLWLAGRPVFDAQVLTCVVCLERPAGPSPVRRWWGPAFEPAPDGTWPVPGTTWAPLVADLLGAPPLPPVEGRGRLGDLATVTAGFRAQYYDLVPHVRDGGPGAPLVTCGLLEAGRCAWGERPARFAKRTWDRPTVGEAMPVWARRLLVPKVLVATQTRVVEAAVDAHGAWVPSVPVVSAIPRDPAHLWHVGAALLAPLASAWALTTYGGTGLGHGTIKLSAAQVAEVPLPEADALERAAALLRAGDIDGAAAATTGDDALVNWWRARRSGRPATPAGPRANRRPG